MDVSFNQVNFLGGEWSQSAQGRTDDPRYKTASNVMLNALPLEEGAWTRRAGFYIGGWSFLGQQSKAFSFNYSVLAPMTMEIIPGFTRFWTGINPVFDNEFPVIGIYPTTPLTVLVDPACPYNTGDHVRLLVTSGPNGSLANLVARDYRLTQVSANLYSLTDDVSGANIPGSLSNFDPATMTAVMARWTVLTNPYVSTADLQNVKVTQAGANLLLFNPNYPTHAYTIQTLNTTDPRFSTIVQMGAQQSAPTGQFLFGDGPYYPAVFGQTATPSATTGNITVTLTGGFGPRATAQQSDVGKIIRMYSEPLLYQSGTSYSLGQNVTWPVGTGQGPGNHYTSLKNTNVGNTPDTNPQAWGLSGTIAVWAWGLITAVDTTGLSLSVTMEGGNGLEYTNPCNYFQVGLFGGVDGYPTDGTVHEGRLWPVYQNWALASMPYTVWNNYNNYSPTDEYGNVNDSSGIAYFLQTGDQDDNSLSWLQSGPAGLMGGSLGGEWLIQASSLNDPITPTSFQAHKISRYGAANIKPARTGLSLVFVQKFGKRLLELVVDVFTQKFAAPNLSLKARHIGRPQFAEISYQEVPLPIVWTRDVQNGALAACLYRRLSSFITEEPTFVGWSRHQLGVASNGPTFRSIVSLNMTPTSDSKADALTIVSVSPTTSSYFVVEQMQPLYEEGATVDTAFCLDAARPPTAMVDTAGTGVLLSGFWNLIGSTVTAYIAGLNCGTYTVNSSGQITVPYGSDPDGLFTQAYMLAYPNTGVTNMQSLAARVVTTPPASYSATPATIGSYPFGESVLNGAYADWGNGYFFLDGTVSAAETLGSFNIATRASVATIAGSSINSGNFITLGPGQDGFLYLQDSGNTYSQIRKVDAATMTLTSVFGADSGSGVGFLTPPEPTIIAAYAASQALVAAHDVFLLIQGNAGGGVNSIYVYSLTQGVYANFANYSQLECVWVPGKAGVTGQFLGLQYAAGATIRVLVVSLGANAYNQVGNYDNTAAWNSGTAYVVGATVYSSGAKWVSILNGTNHTPGNSSSYWATVNQNAISQSTPGTLAAASLDAGATQLQFLDGGYDTSDGNLIAWIECTAGSPAFSTYVAKINLGNMSIMWKTGLPSSANLNGLKFSNINLGVFGFLDESGNYYSLNTATGALNLASWTVAHTTQTPMTAPQLFNGTTNSLYTRYAATTGTGAPTPLSGTTVPFTDWAIYTPFTAFNPTTVAITGVTVPAIVGLPYTSQGQLVRPGTPQESGAANGPPAGKTRRSHMFTMQVVTAQTSQISIGTDFVTTHPVTFKTPGGTLYQASAPFSGVKWDLLNDKYDFDGMIAWSCTGPYPCTLASIGGFIHTQDR